MQRAAILPTASHPLLRLVQALHQIRTEVESSSLNAEAKLDLLTRHSEQAAASRNGAEPGSGSDAERRRVHSRPAGSAERIRGPGLGIPRSGLHGGAHISQRVKAADESRSHRAGGPAGLEHHQYKEHIPRRWRREKICMQIFICAYRRILPTRVPTGIATIPRLRA